MKELQPLPLDTADFAALRREVRIYVDKTAFVGILESVLRDVNSNCCFFENTVDKFSADKILFASIK